MTCVKGLLVIVGVCFSIIFLTFLTMSLLPNIRKSKNPNLYRAAVLEVAPITDTSISIADVIQENLQTYQLAANLAASEGVDIIVFPEGVLFENVDDYANIRSALIGSIAIDVPNPAEGVYNPCIEEKFFETYLLKNLSCMAMNNKMFLVANIVDYKKCKDGGGDVDRNATLNCSDEKECPDDGMYLFNTNVVFDREGKLIARYHKKHLYFEPTMNASKCPDNGYFETEFGKFTTIVCFDIVFKEAIQAIEQTHVDNLAYPYYWFDHTPFFYFANIFQQSFSVLNQINVIAANGHVPNSGTVGSGVFSASNGALMYTHQPDGITKLLVTNVPKDPKNYALNFDELNRKRFAFENGTFSEVPITDDFNFQDVCEKKDLGKSNDSLMDYHCDSTDLGNYTFTKLKHKEGEDVQLCVESFCCFFTYKARSMDEDYFMAVSATPFMFYEQYGINAESCFISRCTSADGKRCTKFNLKSETVFERAVLRGTFINKYVFPFSVDSNLELTNKNKWNFDGKSQITYQNSDNSSLLFFGLYGRDYG